MKIRKIKVVVGIFSLILLNNLPNVMAAESFGRLFTTNANRTELNNLRQTQKLSIAAPTAVSDESTLSAPVVLPDAVTMQGYVQRTDGKKSTVWVNNQAVQENESIGDVQIGKLSKNSNQVPLKLPVNGKRFSLKAGQVYSPADNSVSEARPYAVQGEAMIGGRIGDDTTTNDGEK